MKKLLSLISLAAAVLLFAVTVFTACSDGGETPSSAASTSDEPASVTSSEATSAQSEASSETSSEAPSEPSSEPSSEASSETESKPESKPASSEAGSSDPTPSSEPAPTGDYASAAGYVAENDARYNAYGKKHKDLSDERVVAIVNFGYDGEFYTNVQPSPNQQTKYVLVNKFYYLDRDYVPDDLVALPSAYKHASNVSLQREAYDAFIILCDAAKKAGYTILGQSGYRSYETQEKLYNKYLKNEGGNVAAVDSYSARPGHSEHQTGLAIDVVGETGSMGKYGKSKSYKWAVENVWKYGFIIHYTTANEYITGYETEEWHFRFVGKEAAAEIHSRGITVDEYLAEQINKLSS